MATLLLRSAGAAAGTFLGGPLGGLIGGAVGAIGGAVVDSLVINALQPHTDPPQLDAIALTSSSEGGVVRKLWGRMRLGGNVIWTTQFQAVTGEEDAGSGKGSGGSTETTRYLLSFAVAFCEGGRVRLSRVWADGNELDLSQVAHAFYPGSEVQLPDSFIESIEGVGNVPAYRGIAYLVFHRLSLDGYGNRMPQITAELHRTPPIADPDDVTKTLRSVALLPGAGEFVLGTTVVQSSDGDGSWFPENAHGASGLTDFSVSLAQLGATLPNAAAVSLVVTWFGTDLRAGVCQILPKVETSYKTVDTADWTVGGVDRASAAVVSLLDPGSFDPDGIANLPSGGGPVPAFGGTPSDNTVIEAIAAIHAAGLAVMFYPFIMMDVPPGNGLPDPYGGGEQATFPWRGRVTCHPAPGQPGSVDRTAAAAAQVQNFFTQYSAMVMHYARLCVAAGGVEAFVIGSELVGLTTVRAAPGDASYPAVDALRTLAARVRAVVGPSCELGYAADWSEYHSHRPVDGTDDVIFNMDPLWSDPNIDFIGIDNYLPAADWRDGSSNLDADPVAGPTTIYDKAYLARNIEGGEYYDWYYRSDAERVDQSRTPIVDTAHGEHWVFRQKDIRNWWSNAHHSRPGGVEKAASTGFVPQGKPVWFTEFGCPAVDKGPNQPNVFYDPKSSESFLAYFSAGSKDDPVQRAYLEATLSYWRDHAPTSSVYGGPMVSTDHMFAWAWDARPFTEFPGLSAVWHDTPNYELGHWLTGRIEQIPLRAMIAELCLAVGITEFDVSGLASPSTLVLGYATSALTSPRDILAGLMDAYGFDCCESGGRLRFFSRSNVSVTAVPADDLAVERDADPGYALTRSADTDLPGTLRLSFADPFRAYATAGVDARKPVGGNRAVTTVSTAAALDPTYASDTAMSLLQQIWAARENASIKLPPSWLALDPGDGLALNLDGAARTYRIRSVATTTLRALDLSGFDPSLTRVVSRPDPRPGSPRPGALGAPILEFVDLPPVTGTEAQPWAPRVVAYASPWAGIDIYRANAAGGFDLAIRLTDPAALGELTAPLYPGPTGRWDLGNSVSLRLYGAADVLSLPDAGVLAGAGAFAVRNPANGFWEVLQFANAALTGQNSYTLSRLLRGQLGSEAAMGSPVPAGSRVVFLDASPLVPLSMSPDARGLEQRFRYGPSPYPVGDTRYRETAATFGGLGLKPWSVSQIEGRRASPATDVRFTWVRRTRFAGSSWDPDTVPLNEDAERYDLEVLDGGGHVVRTAAGLTAPAWTYTSAAQAADFGAPQPAYTVAIYQLSGAVGRGWPATRTVFP